MVDILHGENAFKLPRTCLIKMQAIYPTLKRAEKKAADLLLLDPEVLVQNTIVEAASISGCSETTWFRLSKRLGYSGFHELRAEIGQHLHSLAPARNEPPPALYENVSSDSSPSEIAARVFDSSVSALRDTLALLDENSYTSAVDALCRAGKIVLCGVGDAYAVVRSAYQKFFRAGLQVYESADQDLQLVAVSQLSAGDAVIAISYSGKTKSIVELSKFAREREATVIAITNFPTSPLTKNSDIVLLTASFTSHASGEIVSKRITQLCLIESLYVNILLRSGQGLDENIRRSNDAIQLNKI